MKTRAQIYERDAASLLRDVSMYHVLKEEQLLRMHPGKRNKIKNLLTYLVKQQRIWEVDGYYCDKLGSPKEMDQELFSAVWVLADFGDRADYHQASDYPTKIIFYADGWSYEIVYATPGKETMLSHVIANIVAKAEASKEEQPSNYLVIVDNVEQIEQLQIPHACGYCTVSPEGEVQYYQKEGGRP